MNFVFSFMKIQMIKGDQIFLFPINYSRKDIELLVRIFLLILNEIHH